MMKIVFETADELADAGFAAGKMSVLNRDDAAKFLALNAPEQRELIGSLCVLAEGVELVVEPTYADGYCEACEDC